MENVVSAVRRLQEAKARARALGMFVEERELLECPACGLWEDVNCEGILLVYRKGDPSQVDSGLRFREIDETNFVCPVCGAVVTVEEK
jgi:rubredoxin